MELLTQSDNTWIQLMKAKYLKTNNSKSFLETKKINTTSSAWKHY